MSVTALLDVTAVGLGRLRRHRPGLSSAPSRPNGLIPHQACRWSSTWARTSPMVRSEAAPRSIGDWPPPRRGGPAGAEELLAGRDEVVGAGADPLGVQHEHVAVGGSSSTSISISSTSAGASDSIPSTAMPSASLSVISRSCGCALPSASRTAAHLVGEQQLAARRRPEPLAPAPGCAGRPPRSCGSRPPRRRRTPPAAGAPRSAGRRRRCRRGPRTRRASPPGRPASTPPRRAARRPPRARPPGPARAPPARGRPVP